MHQNCNENKLTLSLLSTCSTDVKMTILNLKTSINKYEYYCRVYECCPILSELFFLASLQLLLSAVIAAPMSAA